MELQLIQQKIHEIRGQKVMLDFDLAELYEVKTKVLNQAVKRNIDRFPPDFMFQLSSDEWKSILNRSQIVTGSQKHREDQYLPYAFTEHGVAMLSSVLRSQKAIEMNIAIVRAFIALRQFALNYKDLAEKIEELESKYDGQFDDVYEALQLLLSERKNKIEQAERKRIGYKKDV